MNNAADDAWFSACSHGGDANHNYPYGSAYSAAACNGPERDAGGALAVGTLAACTGGYAGLFDMTGNVDEWIDTCGSIDGGTDLCVRRGGTFTDPAGPEQTCTETRTAARSFTDDDIGFRCCSK